MVALSTILLMLVSAGIIHQVLLLVLGGGGGVDDTCCGTPEHMVGDIEGLEQRSAWTSFSSFSLL